MARPWAQGWRKEWTVSEPCSQIVHYWCWRVKNTETQSQGALGARSAWKEHPCRLRHLRKVDQPPQLRSQPWNQSLALVCRGPQPLGAPLSEDELSEELGELLTLSPSGFQIEASPFDWLLQLTGCKGVVFSIENFNTRPSFHCIIQNTKMVLGEK